MNSEDQLRLENAIKDKVIIRKEVLKLKSKKNLDDVFRAEHDLAFKKRDCLACANCCKTTSPIFRDTDVKRIAKHLRVKESQFIASYLKMDDENDLVLKLLHAAFFRMIIPVQYTNIALLPVESTHIRIAKTCIRY